MNRDLAQFVRFRAGNCCEYCLLAQSSLPLPFQIDHIIAEQHGGLPTLNNLALACAYCNRRKGPNIAGLDPETNQVVPLFHPRTDNWDDHFAKVGTTISGRTAKGRVTVQVLALNAPDQVALRTELLKERKGSV